ncbi:MAG: MFS transporter [Sinimarinibacterium flocculans]|uniref:MFS transporter n=1 Tax=Sinimarinibacterium flocculans TaxID=985250 RepID=UPI003C5020B5
MSYFAELRTHWRPLAASTIGHGVGIGVMAYIVGTFAPHLLAEFGWTRSQFALLGTATLLTLVFLPVVGRAADLFGVRRTALLGVIYMPMSFYALSTIGGDFRVFIAIVISQVVLGIGTSTTVYSRLVAERFVQARGLGLAIMASGPAIVGAIGSPLLSDYIDEHGWRAGYRLMAVFTACLGVLALALVPSGQQPAPAARRARSAPRDYAAIARSRAFWLIAGGMFLCNIAAPLHGPQLKLMLLDAGAPALDAARLVSLYAIGVIVGRFACGLALDRFAAHRIAALSMGLPAIGMFLIASPLDAWGTLWVAVSLMGLSQGAEGDIAGYLVVRHFGVGIFSSVLGLIIAALGVASSLGALLLSLSLSPTDSYTPFLAASAVAVLVGSLLFLGLGRSGEFVDPAAEAAPASAA